MARGLVWSGDNREHDLLMLAGCTLVVLHLLSFTVVQRFTPQTDRRPKREIVK